MSRNWSCGAPWLLSVALVAGTAGGGGAPRGVPFDAPWLGFDTVPYPDGVVSRAARAADFNSDGVPDLAVVSGSNLAILFGAGAPGGGFLPASVHPTLLHALDLEVADFDGDKDFDIVVADTGPFFEGATISLFRNLGAGEFEPAGAFAAGGAPSGLAVADFNGDGWPDVAAAHDKYIEFAQTVAVILNDAEGGFAAPQVIVVSPGAEHVAAGDLDGDGDADLVVAHKTSQLTVVRNDGSFVALPVLEATPCGLGAPMSNVTLADVDLDGDLDALYSHRGCGASQQGVVVLFRNQGGGMLVDEALPLTPGYGSAVRIAVADIDADGWPDVLTAAESTQAWMLSRGDGRGGFLPAVRFRATEAPVAALPADLDQDGDLDVAVLGRDSLEAAVHLNRPDLGSVPFAQPATVEMACILFATAGALAVGDIDLDGDLDLVVGVSNTPGVPGPSIAIRRNEGAAGGPPRFAPVEFLPTPHMPQHLRLRDIDADGDLDLLWAPWQDSARFRVRWNDGTGQFGADVLGPMAPAAQVESLEVHDVDGDGDLDVLMGYLFALGVSLNDGGAFAAFQPHELPVAPSAVALGDFDEDGHADLLVNSGEQGYVTRSLGEGDGTFGPPTTFPTGRGVRDIAVADVNEDGHLDFVAAFNLDGVGMSVRLGDGEGGFLPEQTYHGSFSATWDQTDSIALADADGDGDLDAFSANFGSQDVSYWESNGDGTFQPVIRIGIGLPVTDVEAADVDGDDVPDLLALVDQDSPCGVQHPSLAIVLGARGSVLGDLSREGVVDGADLGLLLGAWGECPTRSAECPADLNGDGVVDGGDLGILLGQWSE